MKVNDMLNMNPIGNTYHFVCRCPMVMDFVGTVKEVKNDWFVVQDKKTNRMVKLYNNHPNLNIYKV